MAAVAAAGPHGAGKPELQGISRIGNAEWPQVGPSVASPVASRRRIEALRTEISEAPVFVAPRGQRLTARAFTAAPLNGLPRSPPRSRQSLQKKFGDPGIWQPFAGRCSSWTCWRHHQANSRTAKLLVYPVITAFFRVPGASSCPPVRRIRPAAISHGR